MDEQISIFTFFFVLGFFVAFFELFFGFNKNYYKIPVGREGL